MSEKNYKRTWLRKSLSENAIFDESSVNGWIADFPNLIESIDYKNILNCDKRGLLFLLNKMLYFKRETCHGDKHRNETLAVFLYCNAYRLETLLPKLIWKYMKQRCCQKC